MNTESSPLDSPVKAQEYLERAYDYKEQELFEEAISACDFAIELVPNYAEAHNLRGLILDELGQVDKAVAAYREAVQFNPAFQEAQENLREAATELKRGKSDSTVMQVNDSIKCPIAGLWRRILAALIDILVLVIPLMIVSWFVVRDFAFSLGPWGRLIGIVLMILYFGLGNSSLATGQTIGKRVTKIAVVSDGERYLTIKQSVWRSLVLTFILMTRDWDLPPLQAPLLKTILNASVTGLGLALLYGIVFNQATRQGVHDLIVGSYVIVQSRLPDVSLPQCPPVHKKVVLGLIVAGLLVGSASLLTKNLGATLGLVEASKWNEMTELLKVLNNEERFFSVEIRLIREEIYGHSQIRETLEIEVWAKQLCHRDLEQCKDQVEDIARIALGKYDNIDQLTGIRVIIANRYDWGLTTGHLTYSSARTVDDWRRALQ